MKAKGYKRVSEEDFNYVKQLQDAKLTPAVIHQLTRRSLSTVKRMLVSDTFADYQQAVKEYNDKYFSNRNKKASEPEVKAEDVTEQDVVEETSGESDYRDSQEVIVLTRIAIALERLADAWENTPKKRSLF